MFTFAADITENNGHYAVNYRCTSHPTIRCGGGWSTGKDARLALRLQVAVNAQAVLRDARIATDVHGKEYISVNQTAVLGRRMSADLMRLGF